MTSTVGKKNCTLRVMGVDLIFNFWEWWWPRMPIFTRRDGDWFSQGGFLSQWGGNVIEVYYYYN